MSDNENKNPNRRFIAKVKKQQGQYGEFLKILIDNPLPTKKDKEGNEVEDTYNKGVLLWLDNVTGKKYAVLQMSVHDAPSASQDRGFTNSISITLDNTYEVKELG